MLLKLENIGKIYNSDDILVVGIRGVNLEFDYNEFVTIEGESGSGKSTLLNVIGANDTYEEGELYFNGEETSHYSEDEWEKYREDNIATVFQDFNIIDNITVLENVELALFRLDDPKERRKVALQLIEKVGLKKQVNQRASKLSGGEKQRTVIARALAKDSPIILADEPTGNLDVKSSREIASLLKEVSKDKLVIVVTHNPEFFEKYATRRVRIFDGKVSEDRVIEEPNKEENKKIVQSVREEKSHLQHLKNTLHIGTLNYKSRPKFTAMMTFALFVCAITLFIIMSFFSSSIIEDTSRTFDETPIEGKVIVSSSGKDITLDELDKLSNELNADHVLLDKKSTAFKVTIKRDKNIKDNREITCLYNPSKYYLEEGEGVLVIPASLGKEGEYLASNFINANCGIKNIKIEKTLKDNQIKLYLSNSDLYNNGKKIKAINSTMKFKERSGVVYSYVADETVNIGTVNIVNSTFYEALGGKVVFSPKPDKAFIIAKDNEVSLDMDNIIVKLNPEDYEAMFAPNEVVASACLYFKDNALASKAIDNLPDGYMGMLSNSKIYVSDVGDVFTTNVMLYIALIAISVLFAMLIVVIFMRSVRVYGQDFAVYKTLGISRKISAMSLYIEMLFIFLPSLLLLPLVSLIATIIPGSSMVLIGLGDYIFIEALLLFIVEMVAYSFNKGINHQSIRKSLKRGSK